MSPEIHAAIIGGLLAGAVVAASSYATWQMTLAERRSRQQDDESTLIEQAAWKLAAVISRQSVTCSVLRSDTNLLGVPSRNAVTTFGEVLAELASDATTAFSIIKARGSSYPRLLTVADDMMTASTEIMKATTVGTIEELEEATGAYGKLIAPLQDAIAALPRHNGNLSRAAAPPVRR